MPDRPNLITLRDLLQSAMASHQPTQEVTALTPQEESAFQSWAQAKGIRDVDQPESHYDYRGYFKNVVLSGGDQTKEYADGKHYPDTYKQHGHPTFSTESKYSRGANDGGNWVGETFIPQSMNPGSFRDLLALAMKRSGGLK